MMPYCRNLEDN